MFKKAEAAFKTLAIFAPKEKAEELGAHIANLSERMEVQIMMYIWSLYEDTRIDSSDGKNQYNFLKSSGVNQNWRIFGWPVGV